jgi:translation initiation factor IF-3
VDPDGTQLGIKPLPEALAIARQMDLDLVEVAPNANPPVSRIMDYGKFKFDEAQRAKESRRKTTSSSIKEMKYRPKIGSGDFDTKTRQVVKFLNDGHKVKITIMFRGREMSHPELGMKILDNVAEQVGPIAKVEASPKLDGRNMTMVLAPDRRAQRRAGSQREAGAAVDAGPAADSGPAREAGRAADAGTTRSRSTEAPSGNGGIGATPERAAAAASSETQES